MTCRAARRILLADLPPLDEWPLSRHVARRARCQRDPPRTQSSRRKARRRSPRTGSTVSSSAAWALLRGRQAGVPGPHRWRAAGQLGGSQAGARLTYNFTRQIAASLAHELAMSAGAAAKSPPGCASSRSSASRSGSPPSGASGSAASAAAATPSRCSPKAASTSGRCRGSFSLDAYLQGGVVGVNSRDRFVDGGSTVTRPVYQAISPAASACGAARSRASIASMPARG